MKADDVIRLLENTYTQGETLKKGLSTGALLPNDDYTPCPDPGCSHQKTCFSETAPRPGREKHYIAVATQVGSKVISFGPKGCGNLRPIPASGSGVG